MDHRCRRVNRSCANRGWCHHDWRWRWWRRNDCRSHNTSNYATNEPRPEITSSATPETTMPMVMTVMMVMKCRPDVMHHGTRTMPMAKSSMMIRPCYAHSSAHDCRSHSDDRFLVHVSPFLSACLALHTARYVNHDKLTNFFCKIPFSLYPYKNQQILL